MELPSFCALELKKNGLSVRLSASPSVCGHNNFSKSLQIETKFDQYLLYIKWNPGIKFQSESLILILKNLKKTKIHNSKFEIQNMKLLI